MSQAPTGGGGMTPFEIGSLVLGAGNLAGSLFNKPKEQKVDTSADFYAQFFGPMFGGANQNLSYASAQAQIQEGKAAGLQAMYGGAETNAQLGAFGQALDEQRTASNLQAGIAGQSAGAALGLEESAGKGKLATELQPVQTAGELAKSYADAAGKISQQGTQNLGEIAKSKILGTTQLGDTGIKAQQGIAEKTIGAASEQGAAAQQGTSLLANTLQQGTTELGKTTLAGETELLKATSSALPAAGLAALAGENALAQDIAKTNLRIKENQESIRGQIALRRAINEGEQATRRQGALFAMQGHHMFS
jgi:hypothetical protein